MDQPILKQISQKLRKTHPFSVQRAAFGKQHDKSETARFSAHVSEVLKGLSKDMNGNAPRKPKSRDHLEPFGGLCTQQQYEKHVIDRISSNLSLDKVEFDFTVPNGCSNFGPPYDQDWGVGIAETFGSTADGSVITIAEVDGQSAGGVAFHLTTNEPVLASITPQGTYQWSWFNLLNFLPDAWTTGGMGITIYTDSQTEPTLSRQPVLWSASAFAPLSGQTGNGLIANAASPAFGFGAIPLAPALLNMIPGSRYLVWVWCWQLSHHQDGDGFFAILNYTMPSVTVCAGPPIVIH
jgi:hypothetical protein